MPFSRRNFILAAAALGSATPLKSVLAAFPDQPARIQLSFAAGGQVDGIVRQVAAAWGRELNQTMLIENRPGAGGNIAAKYVATAPPTGYIILAGGIGALGGLNAAVYKNPGFDAKRDFTLIGLAFANPGVLCISRTVLATNLKEFLAYAKQNPRVINYASGGTGSSSHLIMELLEEEAKIEMVHVPYRQSPQGTTDLLAGIVQARILGVSEALAFRGDRAIRPLAVTGTSRHPLFPELPSVSELVPGFDATFPSGFAVPSKTPADVVTLLRSTLRAALKRPELIEGLRKAGSGVWDSNVREEAYLEKETRKWEGVITRAGILKE